MKLILKVISNAVIAGMLSVLLYSTAKISLYTLFDFSTPTRPRNEAMDFVNPIIDHHNHDNGPPPPPPMILPINQRKLDSTRGDIIGGVRDVLLELLSLSSRIRKIDERSLPFPCGVILYVNFIPGDTGDALNEWIARLVEESKETTRYATTLLSSENYESKQVFINEVEKNIRTIGANEWTFINYLSKHDLSFSKDEHVMHSWRQIVEEQSNCKFVAAAVFSDPLDHSIKHTKRRYSDCNNCEVEEFEVQIMQDVTSNPWMGQLDHFLYSTVDESASMVTKEKVRKGIQFLVDHFDLVLIDGKGNEISDTFLKITGWSSNTRPRKAIESENYTDGMRYSKNLVNAFSKMSTKNGDTDFIDAINHVYYNSLGYLVLK